MNIFSRLGNWVVGFFKSDLAKRIFKLGEDILKAVVQDQGPVLQKIAFEEVMKASQTSKSNDDKFKMAYDAILARIKDAKVGENAINLAIELAVAAIKQG